MKSFPLALVAAALSACAGDPLGELPEVTGPAVSDAELYLRSQPDASWTYFKRSAIPIKRSSSAHTESHALVRYNALAATQLDAAGRVRAGASFPDSSIIVKELSNGTTVSTYAVMMKLRGAASAGYNGWTWAEFGPTGAVKYQTKGRGAACSTCHAPGIDYTRMNDSHP